jgi:deazaflavin-dependent oxidoreductase (nitroreductase family)
MDSWHQMTINLINDVREHGAPTNGPFKGRPVLLLTTVGAKSGTIRTTPLVYTTDGNKWVIVASKGGSDSHPAWYLNLLANPNATIETGGETISVTATPAHGAERRRLYDQHASMFSGFLEYEKKTTREIPVLLLERSTQPGPTPPAVG